MLTQDSSTAHVDTTTESVAISELHEYSEPVKSKPKLRSVKNKPRIILNISCSHYEVVRHVAKKLYNWKLSKSEDNDWDVFWSDAPITPDKFKEMKQHQKINHFPSMTSLGRKNQLSRNLARLRKIFPTDYNFFPSTWNIPTDMSDLRRQFQRKNHGMLIVKPEASSQGKGIFITNKLEDIKLDERMVVQQYIHNPLLIDNLKFDLRIYVLITGCDPLRIFIHEQGLARFATESYLAPSSDNIKDICMHLTNYAINKQSDKFQFNENSETDDVGHKRSLASVFKKLASQGYDTIALWNGIKDIVVKTVCSVQPTLSHTYKACQPDELSNSMCFEILGFDILIDKKLKPYLLEVNQSPSFTTDTPLDRKIKVAVIKDALDIVGVKRRNLKSEHVYRNGLYVRDSKFTKIEKKLHLQQKRNEWEDSHLGGYQRIYPDCDNKDYDTFISTAFDVMEELFGSSRVRNSEASESLIAISPLNKLELRGSTENIALPPLKNTIMFTDLGSLRSISVNYERKEKPEKLRKQTKSIQLSFAERFKKSKKPQNSSSRPNEDFTSIKHSSAEILHNPPNSNHKNHKEFSIIQGLHKYSSSKVNSPQNIDSMNTNTPDSSITPLENLKYVKLPPSINPTHKRGSSMNSDFLSTLHLKYENLISKHISHKSYDLESLYDEKTDQFPMILESYVSPPVIDISATFLNSPAKRQRPMRGYKVARKKCL